MPARSALPTCAMRAIAPLDASSSRQAVAAAIATPLVQNEPVKKTRVAASRSASRPRQAAIAWPLPSAFE